MWGNWYAQLKWYWILPSFFLEFLVCIFTKNIGFTRSIIPLRKNFILKSINSIIACLSKSTLSMCYNILRLLCVPLTFENMWFTLCHQSPSVRCFVEALRVHLWFSTMLFIPFRQLISYAALRQWRNRVKCIALMYLINRCTGKDRTKICTLGLLTHRFYVCCTYTCIFLTTALWIMFKHQSQRT